MTFLSPDARRRLPAGIFALLVFHVAAAWAMMAFLHRDAQARLLAPDHYQVQVVTADDYRRLADPANRVVTLSDGTTLEKAPIWDEIVLPNYKPVCEGRYYVLVTTTGTAHYLSYVGPQFLMIGFFAACGLLASLWNLSAPPAHDAAAAPGDR